jgi:DNA-binding beta-propeller fold protein YncE
MRTITFLFCLLLNLSAAGQGYNHQWLLGSANFQVSYKGRAYIDALNFNIQTEFRKMPFYGTQGNICDANGNFLMSSNGVWIANANNDTMLNGSGLNPGGITPNWPNGLPMVANNVFVPYPGDTNKFILFHHSADTFNGVYSPVHYLFQTVIDMNLDNGLGGVVIKNDILLNDTINGGIGICKHANGRDWWVIVHKDSSDLVFKILINNTGVASITTQHLNYLPLPWGNFAQLTFSPDGSKFIATTYTPFLQDSYLIIADFDRCTGIFSNIQSIQLTNSSYLLGLAFSPSGKYAYACSSGRIFQVDVNTLSVDTVAVYDGFISPPGSPCCPTTFWNMYLAANGKIYITSGSGVQHLHVMNYPDSAGTACDVQQHAIDLVNYLHLRAVPNHPNYYLGCDTTQTTCPCLTGISEPGKHDFKFSLSPNPSSGFIKILYLLPQNHSGVFEVYDITGKKVFTYPLPPWSTLQHFDLSFLNEGIYQCIISSNGQRAVKKVVMIKD